MEAMHHPCRGWLWAVYVLCPMWLHVDERVMIAELNDTELLLNVVTQSLCAYWKEKEALYR